MKGFPTIFAHDGIFGRCPYLLPNLICTIIVFCSLVVGVLFLEETHEDKKHRKDYGLELGAWIEAQLRSKLSCLESAFSFCSEGASYRDRGPLDEGTPYHPVKQPDPSPNSGDESHTTSVRTPSLIEALNSQMVLKILGYGLLALLVLRQSQGNWYTSANRALI